MGGDHNIPYYNKFTQLEGYNNYFLVTDKMGSDHNIPYYNKFTQLEGYNNYFLVTEKVGVDHNISYYDKFIQHHTNFKGKLLHCKVSSRTHDVFTFLVACLQQL